MYKVFLFIIALSLYTRITNAQDVFLGQEQASMVSSERAFAAATAILGIRDGFLSFFSRDAVSFDAGLQNAYDLLKKRKPPTYPLAGKLSWAPQAGDIAKSGDFGYLYGPWKFENRKSPDTPACGMYISIWKRDSLGLWKVVFDCGVSTPEKNLSIESVAFKTKSDSVELSNRKVNDAGLAGTTLLAMESVNTILSFADSVTLFRDGMFPSYGKENAGKFYAANKIHTRKNTGSSIASTGDMAYTFGTFSIASDDSTGGNKEIEYQYLHVWKLDNKRDWKLIVDVASKK